MKDLITDAISKKLAATLESIGGGGKADASVNVSIEPVGYLRSTSAGPVFCPIEIGR